MSDETKVNQDEAKEESVVAIFKPKQDIINKLHHVFPHLPLYADMIRKHGDMANQYQSRKVNDEVKEFMWSAVGSDNEIEEALDVMESVKNFLIMCCDHDQVQKVYAEIFIPKHKKRHEEWEAELEGF